MYINLDPMNLIERRLITKHKDVGAFLEWVKGLPNGFEFQSGMVDYNVRCVNGSFVLRQSSIYNSEEQPLSNPSKFVEDCIISINHALLHGCTCWLCSSNSKDHDIPCV